MSAVERPDNTRLRETIMQIVAVWHSSLPEGNLSSLTDALLPVVHQAIAEEFRAGAEEWRAVDAQEWRPVIAWLLSRASSLSAQRTTTEGTNA